MLINNFNDISFRNPVKQSVKYKKPNLGVSVYVYSLDKENKIFPIRVCDKQKVRSF